MGQKKREGKQDFKKVGVGGTGVKAGSRGGYLTKRGLEPPYELWCSFYFLMLHYWTILNIFYLIIILIVAHFTVISIADLCNVMSQSLHMQ